MIEKFRIIFALLSILILTAEFTSCSSGDVIANEPTGPERVLWVLDSLDGSKLNLPAGAQITLNFDVNSGELSGSGICNNYYALYQTLGGKIKISRIGYTKDICVDNALERLYLKNLPRVDHFEIENSKLYLTIGGKRAFIYAAKK